MSVLYQTWVKVLLLALLVVLAVTRFYLVRWRRERAGRWLSLAALPVVLLAIVSFNSYGQFWTPRFLNYHDIYHYYFGSKYSDELGYDRLYHCTLLAINETDPRQHEDVVTVRSLVSYQHVAKKWYLDRPQLCRDRFSAQRWAEFKADLVSFRKGRFSSWKEMLKDKGYNPSPVWNMVGRLIAHHVPVQPWQALNVLGSLDLALLGLAMVLAVWGFGWWGAALGIIYLGGCYALTKTHIRGAFLRLDWLAFLIASLAALQRQHHRLAGALLGYAAMVRIFPILFLFGPAVRGLQEWYATRRLPHSSRRLFGSFIVTCLLLFSTSVLVSGGTQPWGTFIDKMKLHARDIATVRIGLEYVLSYRGEIADRDYRGEDGKGRFRPGFVEARQRVDRQMRWVRATIAGLVLGLLALGLRRRDEVEAMALSFPAIFCLSNPTFYYWCLLVPVVLVMASRSVQGPALALLLGIALVEASYLLLSRLALFELFQYAFYSAEMGALALLALLVLQRWPAAAAPQPVTKWGRALPPKLAAPPAAPLTGADASGADASGALVAVQEGGERHPLPGEERSS